MNRFKLTREQRHEVYKAALEYYDIVGGFAGLCASIECCNCDIERPAISTHPAQYPEIFKQCPKWSDLIGGRHSYWWPVSNIGIRYKILQQAMDETKPL